MKLWVCPVDLKLIGTPDVWTWFHFHNVDETCRWLIRHNKYQMKGVVQFYPLWTVIFTSWAGHACTVSWTRITPDNDSTGRLGSSVKEHDGGTPTVKQAKEHDLNLLILWWKWNRWNSLLKAVKVGQYKNETSEGPRGDVSAASTGPDASDLHFF